MTAPSISLTEQMLRRRPVIGAPVAHGASDHLKRSIGTFQLTMFGVGATVGSVIPTLKAIIPAAVGVDIGCGMIAVRTGLQEFDLPADRASVRVAIEKAIPLSAGARNQRILHLGAVALERHRSRHIATGRKAKTTLPTVSKLVHEEAERRFLVHPHQLCLVVIPYIDQGVPDEEPLRKSLPSF